MNSTVPPSFHFGMNHQGQRARHTSTVRNLKIDLSENIVLLLHPRVNVPYSRTSWLLRNLSLDGEVCLRNDKNVAFLKVHHLKPVQASMENATLCARISRKQALSDWLNPHSLGIISACSSIANLA